MENAKITIETRTSMRLKPRSFGNHLICRVLLFLNIDASRDAYGHPPSFTLGSDQGDADGRRRAAVGIKGDRWGKRCCLDTDAFAEKIVRAEDGMWIISECGANCRRRRLERNFDFLASSHGQVTSCSQFRRQFRPHRFCLVSRCRRNKSVTERY